MLLALNDKRDWGMLMQPKGAQTHLKFEAWLQDGAAVGPIAIIKVLVAHRKLFVD